MKINFTDEWCLAVADREGDAEVGTGGAGYYPSGPKCVGCVGHECDEACAYPGAQRQPAPQKP